MKKLVCVLLVLIAMSAAFAPAVFAAITFTVTDAQGNAFATPEGKKNINASIGFKPSDTSLSGDIIVDIIVSTDVSTFPFVIDKTNYQQNPTKNNSGVFVYDFNMNCHKNAVAGYYTINFKISYNDGTEDKESIVPVVMRITGDNSVSVPDEMPRIIISAFSTNPDPVVAGEEITLSVTFTNKTSKVEAKNVKAQLSSDGTFTPVSGSSSIFLGNIGGSSSIRASIKLKVKADVAPNSYSITFDLTYDVSGVEDQMSDSETVSIPVVQVPKLQVSNPQMYPEEIYAGQDMNFMASLNNTGRSTLYNVNVAFEDISGCLMGMEQYIGNIEPGETKNLDVYLSAVMEGESQLIMTITYEDQDGEIYTFTESYAVYVMMRGDTDPMPWPEEPDTKSGNYIWIIIVAIVLLAAGGLVAFLLINRKKKAEQEKQLDQQQIDQWAHYQNMQVDGTAPANEIPEYQQNAEHAETSAGSVEYYQQSAEVVYADYSDMAATTEIPIAEIEAGAMAAEEPEQAKIAEADAKPEKPKKAKKAIKRKKKATENQQEPKADAEQGSETTELDVTSTNSEETEMSGETEGATV